MHRFHRVLTVPVLTLAATLVTAAPATAAPAMSENATEVPHLTFASGGYAQFCLTSTATGRLAQAGITVQPIEPATEQTSGGQQCVRTPITAGQLNLDLSGGQATLGGGFAFLRAQDGRRTAFQDLTVVGADWHLTVMATAGGRRAEFLTSDFAVSDIHLHLTRFSVTKSPVLCVDGASVLAEVFGGSPVPAGEQVFDISAEVPTISAVLGIFGGLLGAFMR